MEVILLERVLGLGELGDKVSVKPGYGRNYLVPQGKALPATKDNVAEFEQRREELEHKATESLKAAQTRKEAMEGVSVTIAAHASNEGNLYGSVGPREVSDALTNAGYPTENSEVVMGEGPVQEVGEYQVPIQLHADVETQVTIVVEAIET